MGGGPYSVVGALSQGYGTIVVSQVKHPWVLKHNLGFWPAWTPIRDTNTIHLYGGCYIDPMQRSAWVLTREWVLAGDTTKKLILSLGESFCQFAICSSLVTVFSYESFLSRVNDYMEDMVIFTVH